MSLLEEARAKNQARKNESIPDENPVSLLAEARAKRGIETEQPNAVDVPKETNQPSPKTTGLSILEELAAATNRGLINIAEFFTTDQINAIANMAGYKGNYVTPLSETELAKSFSEPQITQGMEEGLAKNVVRTAGEYVGPGVIGGAVLRTPKVASSMPQYLKPLAGGSTGADVGYSLASGAGAAVGEEKYGQTGALVGSLLAPMGVAGVQAGLTKALSMGKSGIESITRSVADMSDEGAATLLAESMIREGLEPDDIINRLAKLGDEGLPADVGVSFARLVRAAANKIPRIEGYANQVLNTRQSGQANRILNAVDDVSGTSSLNVDDEIIRLNKLLKPQIDAAYSAARKQSLELSSRLKGLLDGKGSLGKARRKAELRLQDLRDIGETPTNLDLVDQTKRVLDGDIGKALRAGDKEKAMHLVKLKSAMIKEVDEAIPAYKEARDLFAGKAELETIADMGQDLFKLKPSELTQLTSTMSESELKMLKLGAKQAIIDRINSSKLNADLVKKLFGTHGEVKKLKSLYGDQYKQFEEALNKEANFVLTRRIAQENSTTVKQALDIGAVDDILRGTRAAMGDPSAGPELLGRIIKGLGLSKGTEANILALEKAADVLLTSGMSHEKIRTLLRQGSAGRIKELEKAVIESMRTVPQSKLSAPLSIGATKSATEEQ